MGTDRRGAPGRTENPTERFERAVRHRAARRRASAAGHRGVLSWIGVFGMVGWTVSVPALLGAAVGRWLDRTREDQVSWTISLILLGLVVGAGTAWYWVTRESRRDD